MATTLDHVAVHAVARTVEHLAQRLHDLAFDIGEAGVTPHVQAKADAIGDALLAAVHTNTAHGAG